MATEVLLMSDVKDLGVAGAVVTVKDGFARNFLFPQNLAEPVTKNALRKLEKLRKEREELSRIQAVEAKAKAGQIEGKSVTIRARVVDGSTHLYGSVSAGDIAAALEAEKVSVDRSQIVLAEPIKETGNFDIVVRLHADVKATVKVWIVEE